MADKLFKDYFNERQEDNAIVGNTKILIKRGNNVRKIDVDKFATAAQGQLADSAVQPSDLGTMAYEDADDYVDLTSNQLIGGNKTFSGDTRYGDITAGLRLRITGTTFNIEGANTSFSSWNNIHLKADGLNGLLIQKDTNNVGIGTTNPAAKLDVNGNTKITGTLDLNDGSNRTIIGTQAGGSGSNQTSLGFQAGQSNTGANNTNLGFRAGRLTSGINSVNVGYQAGTLGSGNSQTAVGYRSGQSNTGSSQSVLGYEAGLSNTGFAQTAVGYQSGYQNTAVNQTAVGYQSGYQNTALETTFTGWRSGYQNTGLRATGFGYAAARENDGDNVVFLGNNTGVGNEGNSVLGIGWLAGVNNTQNNRTIIDNDLLPAFASFALAEAAFGTGQSGMTYLYFNTVTNAIEGVRF